MSREDAQHGQRFPRTGIDLNDEPDAAAIVAFPQPFSLRRVLQRLVPDAMRSQQGSWPAQWGQRLLWEIERWEDDSANRYGGLSSVTLETQASDSLGGIAGLLPGNARLGNGVALSLLALAEIIVLRLQQGRLKDSP
jgi:hypothetical protein